MNNFIYVRDSNDLDANNQINNLNNIANNQPIFDLPFRYNDNDRNANEFSLYDTQNILNNLQELSNNLTQLHLNMPNNNSIINFIIQEDKELIKNNGDTKHFIKNKIGLRFNPYLSTQNSGVSKYRDFSNNYKVLSNSINYFILESGNILKRVDISSNINYFETGVSGNLIYNNLFSDSSINDISNNNNLNRKRNFINLFPYENDNSLNYSNLYIDYDNDNISNPRLNYTNTLKNIYDQNIHIPSFGVQNLVTNGTEGFNTQIDTINPRATNLLYGIYQENNNINDIMNPIKYNINFNQKSWFKSNIALNHSRGINLGDIYLDTSSNGHFMYQYSINNHMKTNNQRYLLEINNYNIPYTILGNISGGKMNIDNSFEHINGFTQIPDISLSSVIPNISNNDPEYKINLANELDIYTRICCIYFKDTYLKFAYKIENNNIFYNRWVSDGSGNKINNTSTPSNPANNYQFMPFNKNFYTEDNSYQLDVIRSFNNRVLLPFFKHVTSILFTYPDYCRTTVVIGNISNIRNQIPNQYNSINNIQCMDILQDICNSMISSTNLLSNFPHMVTQALGTYTYNVETIIVGISNNYIIYFGEVASTNTSGFFIKNNTNNFQSNLKFNITRFPYLKNIYLRSNTTITFADSCFLNNNNISILDLTGITDISCHNQSFTNMGSLSSIIINDPNDISNSIYYVDNFGSPNFKNIFLKKPITNNITSAPMLTQRSIVIMDLPFNNNIIYPTSVGLNLITTLDNLYLNNNNNLGFDNPYPFYISTLVTRDATSANRTFFNSTLFNININSWDVGNITNMQEIFFSANIFNKPLSNWNVSNVTNMMRMFNNNFEFNQDISCWNVSKVNNMNSVFQGNFKFNYPLENWNVNRATTMSYMFYGGSVFNKSLNNWNVSSVTNMEGMFRQATHFNENISNWNVSDVTNMHMMFQQAINFNKPLYNWNVSSVTNMRYIFNTATVFNQDISSWDIRRVTDMNRMFWSSAFNYPLNSWDVGNVNNMGGMFAGSSFNRPLSSWDVGNVNDMNYMFYRASSFNQPIGNWNVSKVNLMPGMFGQAHSFNQNISSWNVSNVNNMSNMFTGSSFNQNINSWNVSNVNNMSNMFNRSSFFNTNISSWDVRNVNNMHSMFKNAYAFNQDINNWNVSNVGNMHIMFYDATSFNQPLSSWDVRNVNNMHGMFGGSNFNQDINNWNVSNVNNMSDMFKNSNFNQDISNWNVSNVSNMRLMFDRASVFNKPLVNWNVSSVTDMRNMFYLANNFNQPLSSWDVRNVNNMHGMFHNADVFNQDISGWNISKVNNIDLMFLTATYFNSNLNNWDISNIRSTNGMLKFANNFNQPLNNWNVSNITNMRHMFSGAQKFNQDITSWDVRNVSNMEELFKNAYDFNQNISTWSVSNVQNMFAMFHGASVFNQDINNWDVSNVNNMAYMFYGATSFNENISSWDITNCITFSEMFTGSGLRGSGGLLRNVGDPSFTALYTASTSSDRLARWNEIWSIVQ